MDPVSHPPGGSTYCRVFRLAKHLAQVRTVLLTFLFGVAAACQVLLQPLVADRWVQGTLEVNEFIPISETLQTDAVELKSYIGASDSEHSRQDAYAFKPREGYRAFSVAVDNIRVEVIDAGWNQARSFATLILDNHDDDALEVNTAGLAFLPTVIRQRGGPLAPQRLDKEGESLGAESVSLILENGSCIRLELPESSRDMALSLEPTPWAQPVRRSGLLEDRVWEVYADGFARTLFVPAHTCARLEAFFRANYVRSARLDVCLRSADTGRKYEYRFVLEDPHSCSKPTP